MNESIYRESRVKISDKIRGKVVELVTEEKDYERKKKYPAKWYRKKVARELKLADKDNPSLRSYESILRPIRKALQADNPQEKPWSMATLDKYPISPDAVPAVLNVWKFRTENGDTFTVREAKWTARLSAFERDMEKLFSLVSSYARTELMFELVDRPFDSTVLDRSLV